MTPEQHYAEAMELVAALVAAGHKARLVGGAVRDRLLGKVPKDYDIGTTALPAQVQELFSRVHKVVPTGIEFGTVMVVVEGRAYEITTLRRDVTTDGRHAQVEFGNSFREDADRRDFTVNAMSEDLEGKVHDYHHGLSHLRERKIRFVGKADQRICEDYLRILRYFRFQARFSLSTDPETLQALAERMTGLSQISAERITAEVLGILEVDDLHGTTRPMVETGMIAACLGATQDAAALDRLWEQQIHEDKRFQAHCRLAVFLAENDLELSDTKLRLGNKIANLLLSLAGAAWMLGETPATRADLLELARALEHPPGVGRFPNTHLPYLRGLARSKADQSLAAKIETVAEVYAEHGHLLREKPPVNGLRVQELTGCSDREIGPWLTRLHRGFLEGTWHSKEEGEDFLRALLKAP